MAAVARAPAHRVHLVKGRVRQTRQAKAEAVQTRTAREVLAALARGVRAPEVLVLVLVPVGRDLVPAQVQARAAVVAAVEAGVAAAVKTSLGMSATVVALGKFCY